MLLEKDFCYRRIRWSRSPLYIHMFFFYSLSFCIFHLYMDFRFIPFAFFFHSFSFSTYSSYLNHFTFSPFTALECTLELYYTRCFLRWRKSSLFCLGRCFWLYVCVFTCLFTCVCEHAWVRV